MDLVSLVETDLRVQVMFTVPQTTDRWQGVSEFVRGLGGLVLPWSQAVAHRFDLILAASHRHLNQLHGPILLIGHGAGEVRPRRHSRKAGGATQPTTGLDRELLTFRGRVLPALLGLGTDDELELLRDRCPEALPRAVVAGDICLDRMRASYHLRERYRTALGVQSARKLVVISTTWFTDSAFGQLPHLGRAVVDSLPAKRFAVAAVLHPNVWAVHGRRQVSAWLADAMEAGLMVVPPEAGWQATMIAADWVIGDHGSTTGYAAAIGTPVTVASAPEGSPQKGSVADVVRTLAPTLRWDRSLSNQATEARGGAQRLSGTVTEAISSRVDRAAGILRAELYRLLELSEPQSPARLPLLPLPDPIAGWAA
ncbi:hypothetical protein AB0878_46220 [Amycolatopsis sp. NPDC047767]|uniref:hypothetical protein n=1 Tax=Amycolatopsis sp. NPDC047767 TaxID=3156765 RepID=UPI003453C3E4